MVGIKTYVYDLGGGIIELMAIGTAIKKTADIKPIMPNLIVQAVVKDEHTFFNSADSGTNLSLNAPTRNLRSQFWVTILVVIYVVLMALFKTPRH